MIAAGKAREPILLRTLGAGPEIISVQPIEASLGQIELLAGLVGTQESGSELGKDMADQRRGAAMQ